jgi:hypothetical protein
MPSWFKLGNIAFLLCLFVIYVFQIQMLQSN